MIVCSLCGAECGVDAQLGFLYLVCGCDTNTDNEEGRGIEVEGGEDEYDTDWLELARARPVTQKRWKESQ